MQHSDPQVQSRRFSLTSIFSSHQETLKDSNHQLHRLSLVSLSDVWTSHDKLSIETSHVSNNASDPTLASRIENTDLPMPDLFQSFSAQPAPKSNAHHLNTMPSISTLNLPTSNDNNNNDNHSIYDTSTIFSHHRPPYRRSSTGPKKVKEQWHEDFKVLDSEFHKFMSKTGVNKANVLRLALLPFLRQRRAEFGRATPEEVSKRVRILQKWWIGILSALRDRERPVSGSDRSAYLEAVSGLVARNEWLTVSGPWRQVYENLLYDTLNYVIAKLSLKTVPITFAAFAGKIIAYTFFYAPGVAPVLLHLLNVSRGHVEKILSLSFPSDSTHQYTDLETAANLVESSFPLHVSNLVAATTIPTSPLAPHAVPALYGPWARRWTCFNSDVFYSFFRHYYSIIAHLLPAELPWNAHVASPGLVIIHAFLLGTMISVIETKKPGSRE